MTITLDTQDCENIADLILDNGEGKDTIFYSPLQLEVTYILDRDIDDYYSSTVTGSWLIPCTHIDVINITCGDISVEYEDGMIERIVKRNI